MAARRVQLADRWRGIQEAEEADDDGEPSAARQRRLNQAKEEWYGHATRRSQLRIASRRWGGGVTYSTRISAGLVSGGWGVGLGLPLIGARRRVTPALTGNRRIGQGSCMLASLFCLRGCLIR